MTEDAQGRDELLPVVLKILGAYVVILGLGYVIGMGLF